MPTNKEHNTIYRKDYRPYTHTIEKVELDFELDPESTLVTNTMTVVPRAGAHTTDLVLNGEELFFEKVLIDGQPIPETRWKVESDGLVIRDVSSKMRITIVNRFSPQANSALSGIYMGNGKMIDASSSRGKVRTTSNIQSSSYWTSHFICGFRIF